MKESIKRIFSSGMFWAVGAAERNKKPNCHKYATFEVSFLCFQGQFFLKLFSIRTEKLHNDELREI